MGVGVRLLPNSSLNGKAHGVTRCPGLTRMTQELELLSAWLCADIREGMSFKARILELFEGETLMLFTILVPGG